MCSQPPACACASRSGSVSDYSPLPSYLTAKVHLTPYHQCWVPSLHDERDNEHGTASDGGGTPEAGALAPPHIELADDDGANYEDFHGLNRLLQLDTRHLFARYAYAAEWATSIEESHAPSDARAAALATHHADTARIEGLLLLQLELEQQQRHGSRNVGGGDVGGNSEAAMRLPALSKALPLVNPRVQWFPRAST